MRNRADNDAEDAVDPGWADPGWADPGWADPGWADWQSIYVEELPRVYNFFRYRLGIEDDATAQDLTASTFEKAWRARKQYQRNVAAFSTWLFTIARNTATDYFRQQQSQWANQVPLDAAQTKHLAAEELVDEIVQRRLEISELNRLLRGLADRERELIALRYGAGLTNRAIANLLKLSEGNVAQILHRVLDKLRADVHES